MMEQPRPCAPLSSACFSPAMLPLTVSSVRHHHPSSPAATPLQLWPPTPSPTTAVGSRQAADISFLAPGPAPCLREERFAGGLQAPYEPTDGTIVQTAQLDASLGLFAHFGQYFEMAPAWAPPVPQLQSNCALQLTDMLAPPQPAVAPAGPQLADGPAPAAWAAAAGALPIAPARPAFQPPPPAPPAGPASRPMASLGSAQHGEGTCRPCAWYYKPKGCQMGTECDFCHLCPEGELRNRKKAKVAAIRQRVGRD